MGNWNRTTTTHGRRVLPRGTSTPVALLNAELERLHDHGFGEKLHRIIWTPRTGGGIDGEVVGDAIRIYVPDIDTARRVLRHEVLHWEIARVAEPQAEALNAILKQVNQQSYRRAERLANLLEEELAGLDRQRSPAATGE